MESGKEGWQGNIDEDGSEDGNENESFTERDSNDVF